MIDNKDLFIDTKKLENEIWEVSVRHIETGLSTSRSRYGSQIKNLESCKRQIEEMLVFYRFWEDREKSWWSDELTVWLPFYKIEDFVSLIGEDYFCEGIQQTKHYTVWTEKGREFIIDLVDDL